MDENGHSFPVLPDQIMDAAYSPLLLPNYGVGTGRGARLELFDDNIDTIAPAIAPSTAPTTMLTVPNADHACMSHARGSDGVLESPRPAA